MAIEDRTKILLGPNYEKMGKIKVSIAGIGGVGSIIPLILARTGVKKFVLVDKDVVDSSNLNRQIAYDFQDINTRKIDAISQKIEKISPNVAISAHFSRIDDTFDFEIFKDSDFIVDAIDDLHAKVLLIKYALTNNIKIISSLGMGNRIDSTKVEITKYPEDGYVMIKAIFENPTKHSNMAIVYYNDKVLTRRYYDTEFANNTDKHLQLLFDIGCDHN